MKKVDWFSFTFAVEQGSTSVMQLSERVQRALDQLPPEFDDTFAASSEWVGGAGRAPYNISWYNASLHITVFAGFAKDHALCEISGQGCDLLSSKGLLTPLIMTVYERATRLDLAVDMACDVAPKEFIEARYEKKFISHSEIVSKQGETQYLGSMKSDRYCRVYRYAAPHPRSGLLRAEHVFRKKAAVVAAKALLSEGVDGLAASCGKLYGWTHAAWQLPEFEASKLESGQMHRPGKSATVQWLYGTVAQSVKKARAAGKLDLEDFIQHLRDTATEWQAPLL